jgi:hypothetical protein
MTDPQEVACLTEVRSTADEVGTLLVEDTTSWIDLQPLSHLIYIEGGLVVRGNTALRDLQGLELLTQIGGGLIVQENPVLASLFGLGNLRQLGGGLKLLGNASLQELAALAGIPGVRGIWIRDNDALVGLDGLAPVVSGAIEDLSLDVSGNDSLVTLAGLGGSLVTGVDTILIEDNASLVDVAAPMFQNTIENFNGQCTFAGNPKLETLAGTENLGPNCGGIRVAGEAIRDLKIMTNVVELGDLLLETPQLTTLADLAALKTIYHFRLTRMDSLSNFLGIGNATIYSDLWIGNCTDGGGVDWEGNPGLTSLQGLENIVLDDNFINLRIEGNPNLVDVSALQRPEGLLWLSAKLNPMLSEADLEALMAPMGATLLSCGNLGSPGGGPCEHDDCVEVPPGPLQPTGGAR